MYQSTYKVTNSLLSSSDGGLSHWLQPGITYNTGLIRGKSGFLGHPIIDVLKPHGQTNKNNFWHLYCIFNIGWYKKSIKEKRCCLRGHNPLLYVTPLWGPRLPFVGDTNSRFGGLTSDLCIQKNYDHLWKRPQNKKIFIWIIFFISIFSSVTQ